MNISLFCYALAVGLSLQTLVQAHEGDKEPAPAFGSNSLQLIANKGQVTDQHGKLRPDIDAKAEYNGVTMFVGEGQLHYQWVRSESQKSKVKSPKSDAKGVSSLSPGEAVSIYRMDVTLVGADKNVQPVFEQPTGYFENYYLAHTSENGVQAKGYNRVVYKNVYPNIDWVLYVENSKIKIPNPTGINSNRQIPDFTGGNSTGGNIVTSPSERPGEVLKYDFIVHPGGNVADIRMRYDGATELKIEDGELVAVTPYGSITEDAPYSYIEDGGAVVASKYILEGNELRFDVGGYEGTLVIDPKLGWATYYGGNSGDMPEDCHTDTAGNLYVCGVTQSTNNIATNNTHQNTMVGVSDGFVVKFNAAGVRQWGTYFGGTLVERLQGVVADTFGNVYSSGFTAGSTGLATTGAYQDTFGGSIDGILLKLHASNGTRVWSTYFGGVGVEDMYAIECDGQGNVYMGGGANSASGLPTPGLATANALLSTPGWGTLVSFSSTGQRLWCTYYYAKIYDVHYSRKNNLLYICGFTDTTTRHATGGAHQSTQNGAGDGYLACFNTSGGRQWGTYYGGTGGDAFSAVTTDGAGNIYAVGGTGSTTSIATQNAHQTTISGGGGMLVKFTPGGQRIWGTYYGMGGASGTRVAGIGTNSFGMVYFGGMTSASAGIATPGAPQTVYAGLDDLFAGIMDSTGKQIWGSYYGGSQDDATQASMTYGKDKIYVVGATRSSGLATAGAHQTNFIGNFNDCLFVQWDVSDTMVYIKELFTDTFACNGDTIGVDYGVNRPFNSNNTFTVQLSNSSGSFASPNNIGTVSSSNAGNIKGVIPNGLTEGTGYKIRITASSPKDTSIVNSLPIRIANYPAAFSASVNKTTLCTADTLKLNSSTTTTGVTYAWTGPNSFTAGTANATIPNPTLAATGNYYIAIDNKGCVARDTFAVTVTQSPENVTASNNGPVCTGDTLRLQSSSTTGGVTYKWSPGNYSTQNVTIPNVVKTQGGVYTVTATLGNCTTTATTTAQVEQAPVINIVPTAGTALCVGELAQFAAFLNDAGPNPQMIWQVNGVDKAGETTNTFKTATLNHGDKVRLKVIPNTSCPGMRYSNEITMGIYAPKAPTVSIVADVNPPWDDNTIVTFTATAANATSVNGVPPTYQWKKNGQNIGGAVSNYWAVNTNALNDNDKICVLVTSAYECPVPDTILSNCINTQFTGVEDVITTSSINVYPNPVTNILRVEAPLQLSPKGRGLTVELYDVVGRKCDVVYRNGEIDMKGLPAGNYVLQVTGASGERAYFKVAKK